MARILIIDDDEIFCRMICDELRFMGHEGIGALTLAEGLRLAAADAFDVVFLDVRLPDGNGLDILPVIRHTPSSPEVIILTGAGSADGAELAIRSGAWDYVEKLSSMSMMMLPLIRALEYREARMGRKSQQPALILDGIMGSGMKMKACFDQVSHAASTDANVLITGETGTGKELFARAIHENSRRSERKFVVVDCAALQETLTESILFGHEKGAFTGADRPRDGLIRQGDGGTLFLDEVGELPLAIQKAFLRVLQERRFRPLGSTKEMESDFRLVAATNRDLDQMAAAGEFRRDLLFRVRALAIELPPLREHPGDIGEIAIYHLARICRRSGIPLKGLSPEFFESLCAYDWPGNIRELVNTLERAIAAAGSERMLLKQHLPPAMRIKLARANIGQDAPLPDGPVQPGEDAIPSLKALRDRTITEMEKRYLTRLMYAANGDIRSACKISELSPARLYALLKKHRIKPS